MRQKAMGLNYFFYLFGGGGKRTVKLPFVFTVDPDYSEERRRL
jgi:hypothetical protein